MKNVVEVKNVVKSFKDKIVLNHVSFSMKPGEIVGFVGQNGAGKSTLMKLSIPLSEVHAIRYRSPHNPLKKSIFFKS